MDDATVREATPDDVDGVPRVAERGWHAAYADRDVLRQVTVDAALTEWYDATREAIEREGAVYQG